MKVAIVDTKLLCYNTLYIQKPMAYMLEVLSNILYHIPDITDIFFAYDNGKSNYRLSLWPKYKGTRTYSAASVDDSDYLNTIPKIASNLGIINFMPKGVEADDIAGILSNVLRNTAEVVLITADQDWYQIVLRHDHVKIFDVKKFTLMDHLDVFEFTQCKTEEQFLIKKAIIGDSSDNILGITGVGPITFQKWAETHFNSNSNLKEEFISLCREKSKSSGLETNRNYLMEGVHSCEELLDFNMKLGTIMKGLELLTEEQSNHIKAGYSYWKANRNTKPNFEKAKELFRKACPDLVSPFGDPIELDIDIYKEINEKQ